MSEKRFLAAKIASRVKRAVSAVAEVAEAVNKVSGEFRLHNYIALGTIATGKVADFLSLNPNKDPYMIDPVGVPYDAKAFLQSIVLRYPSQAIKEGATTTHVCEVHGSTIITRGAQWDICLWYKRHEGETAAECEERCTQALGRAIWETLGPDIELASNKDKSAMSLRPWDLGTILKSEQTEKALERTKALMKAGGPRSVMLHGPPGTGKTCMARAIASSINGTSLSMTARYLKEIDDTTLSFVLDLLCPSTLVIDDIDRVDDVASMLPAIDRIRPRTRLVLVTVNHLDKVDAAVKRAGRFDDLIEVRRVKNPSEMIPRLGAVVAKEIDEWPIAYVTELKARLDAFGYECLDIELAALRKRVADNEESETETSGKDTVKGTPA